MPEKPFKTNIYEVKLPNDFHYQTPFRVAIDNTLTKPLGWRYMEIKGKGYRLENTDQKEGCYLLDFVSFEFYGPGRSDRDTAAVRIDLGPDEDFIHRTAMLYDPNLDIAIVESTRTGMRNGAIAQYFRAFSQPRTEYLLIPKLDDDAATRARRHQIVRSLIMRVAIGPATKADRDAGIGVIKGFGEEYDAGTIDIEIKAQQENGRTLSLGGIWNTVDSILGSDDDNGVSQLKMYGKEHDDDEFEIIDLIQHRERRERMLPVDDVERTVPYEERWNALLEVRQEFLQ